MRNKVKIKSIYETVCEKIYGGHVTKGFERIGYNKYTMCHEFIIQCTRCKKMHIIDSDTLSKYIRPV